MATLRWLNPGVYIRKAQLDIIDFFNIPDALKQRGFQEVTEAPLSATLITPEAHPCLDTGTRDGQLAAIRFLDRFNSKECRTRGPENDLSGRTSQKEKETELLRGGRDKVLTEKSSEKALRLFKETDDHLFQHLLQTNLEYNVRFKSQAVLLRDEILSRLPKGVRDDRVH